MHTVEAKKILSPQNGMNIYRGCSHGCIYCDARSHCYQMNHAFEDIEVKINAPLLLEQELKKKRKRCMVGTGAMGDPYIHLEEKLQLTRQCLQIINHYDCGLAIQTKSDRILRDLDILKEINQKSKCVVEITLTTFDDSLCQIVEPNVCVTSRRLEILKIMQQNNIPTIVWLSPLLPFINDTADNISNILHACGDAGVYGIMCFGLGLTLRDGNRQYYYTKLDQHFPGLKQKYIQVYGNSYELESPDKVALKEVFLNLCRQYRMESNPYRLFDYMRTYESKIDGQQLDLFDFMNH